MFGLLLRFLEQPVAVPAWLKNMPRRNYFWSNRVTEILSTSKESQWNHISGNGNPADHAPREIPLSDVEKLSFQPPNFLMKPELEWFKPPHREVTFFSARLGEVEPLIDFSRFSD